MIYPSKNALRTAPFLPSVHFVFSPLLVRILESSPQSNKTFASSSSYCPVLSLYTCLPWLCASGIFWKSLCSNCSRRIARLVVLLEALTPLDAKGRYHKQRLRNSAVLMVSRGTYYVCSGQKPYINMFQEAWVQPSPLRSL